jgi:hypothetical protein
VGDGGYDGTQTVNYKRTAINTESRSQNPESMRKA